jgi:lipopolysaccharide biosynthesis glycosyltransferase
MTIAFTICSNNYIAQAKALADSLKRTNPEIPFFIGLLDKFDNIPEEFRGIFSSHSIVEVSELGIPNFSWMNENYDIVEINTAVKPSYFEYFAAKYPQSDNIIFFDPDILVYTPLSDIEQKLNEWNIILTPHLLKPIEDDHHAFRIHEADILNHGVFNLGYIALRRNEETDRFIRWWKERLSEQCRHDLCNGLFVDQLWCNLVPCYFDKVLIDKHPGMNMAYWNLQERVVSKQDDRYKVNGVFDLVFFHFSTFNPFLEDNIADKQNRYKLSDRPDLQPLYTEYNELVGANYFKELKYIACIYGKKPKPVKRYKRVRAAFSRPLRKLIHFIEETV